VPSAQRNGGLDPVEALLRVAVGATALGVDELLIRVRKWEQEVLYNPHRTTTLSPETPEDRARYALIGLLFLATRRTREAAIDFANYSEHQAGNMYRTLSDFARVPVLGILAAPMKAGVDAVLRTRDRELERWIRIGRIEERDGRRIAALGTQELVKEVIDAISRNDVLKESISELVQQQSLDLTGEVVDDLRQGTIDADNRIESIVWRLLGRNPRVIADAPGTDRSRRNPAEDQP
jgi:hypothetical protein